MLFYENGFCSISSHIQLWKEFQSKNGRKVDIYRIIIKLYKYDIKLLLLYIKLLKRKWRIFIRMEMIKKKFNATQFSCIKSMTKFCLE